MVGGWSPLTCREKAFLSPPAPPRGRGIRAVSLNQNFLSGSGFLLVTNLAQFKPLLQELFSSGFANPLLPGGDRKLCVSSHLEVTTALRPSLFPCSRHVCVYAPQFSYITFIKVNWHHKIKAGSKTQRSQCHVAPGWGAGRMTGFRGGSTKRESQARLQSLLPKGLQRCIVGRATASGSWVRLGLEVPSS